MFVRRHAPEVIIEREDLSPHQLLIAGELRIAPNVLRDTGPFEVTLIGWADPPCQHPGDERRQLPSQPKPRPKGNGKAITPSTSDWPRRAKAPWHAPAIWRARLPWRRTPTMSSALNMPKWPTIAPPNGRLLHRR
jgi:hypothetical protein